MRVSVAAESNVRTYGFMRRRHLPLFSCRAIDPPESYAFPHALHMTSAQSLHFLPLPSPFYWHGTHQAPSASSGVFDALTTANLNSEEAETGNRQDIENQFANHVHGLPRARDEESGQHAGEKRA